MLAIDERQLARALRKAGAERWWIPSAAMTEALNRSAAKAFAGREPSSAELDAYLASLHLDDMALACGCEQGHDAAWEHFMREHRPALYRAADAIDPSGGSREIADSLYAELYGLKDRGGERQSLFRYFHGRSSLDTWLRAVLAQRCVDRARAARRLEPLPDEDRAPDFRSRTPSTEPRGSDERRFATVTQDALSEALAALQPRDRMRLGCYYAQGMTLAQIGRLLREHEATASRHLARTRRAIREAVEHRLRTVHQFGDREIDECFASVTEDAGSLDLAELLGDAGIGKKSRVDRSVGEDML